MGALRLNPLKIAEALRINERFGSLLRQERKTAGYALDQVAEKFSVGLRNLHDWEHGLASPPSNVFYAIIKFYGPGAYQRAAMLDMEIQLEKYHLIVASKNGSSLIQDPPVLSDHSLSA